MSAKMEQTESIMKIYFQLCRGAAHFRCLMQTHPQKKKRHTPQRELTNAKVIKKLHSAIAE